MGSYHYKAFISYSHKDHRWGGWLHRRLERYRLPKHLIKDGERRQLKPIFRDREELSAADNLGEKIEQAIAASENLIVICSPQAAKSHWVNQEILSFKRQNRGAKIFSIIVDGEPFSGDADECMPPALRFQLGADGELTDEPAEPLAADLRNTGDGKRLGVLKIISGMLGVGLDELVQRDLQRNRNRVTAITASALATVLAMGTLTGFAVSAQKQAEAARAEADQRRDAAEDMIEFMITELKPELESVGRLKPLSIVGERATKYYDDLPLTSHNDNALGRRARVFHLIGEIEDKYGNLDKAQEKFTAAYESTKALLARDPKNPDRIFDHSQSAFWAGYIPYRKGDFITAKKYYEEYADLAESLIREDPENLDWQLEGAYASTNLAILFQEQGKIKLALNQFNKTIQNYQEIAHAKPNDIQANIALANAFGWLADAHLKISPLEIAEKYRNRQMAIYKKLLQTYPNETKVAIDQMRCRITLIELYELSDRINLQTAEIKILVSEAEAIYHRDVSNIDVLELYIIALIHDFYLELRANNLVSAKQSLDTARLVILDLKNVGTLSHRHTIRIDIPYRLAVTQLLVKQENYQLALKNITKILDNQLFATENLELSVRELLIRTLYLKAHIHNEVREYRDSKEALKKLITLTNVESDGFHPHISQIISNAQKTFQDKLNNPKGDKQILNGRKGEAK